MSWGVILSFLCSLSWLAFDIARKKLGDHFAVIPLSILIMLAQGALFLIAAVVVGEWQVESTYWGPFLAAGLLNLVGNVFFIWGIREAPFSLAVPTLSFTPVFSSLAGWWLLSERLSFVQWMGIGLVVSGAFVLLFRVILSQDLHLKRIRFGLLLMMITALAWAIVPAFDKKALEFTHIPLHASLQCFFIAGVLSLYWRGIKREPLPWGQLLRKKRLFIFGIAGATAALITQLMAVRLIEVGIMESIKRSTELMSSLFVGYFIFKEELTKEKFLAASLLGIGVYLIL